MIRVVHCPPSPNAIASYTEAACDTCGKSCIESRQHGDIGHWGSATAILRAKSAGWEEQDTRRLLRDRDGNPTAFAWVRGLTCPKCQWKTPRRGV